MGILVALIPELISLGIQEAPILTALLNVQAKGEVDDATMAAVEAAIQQLQDKINAA